MKASLRKTVGRILTTAEPLPVLLLGYLIGLLTAVGACSVTSSPDRLVALPALSAYTAAVSRELPLFAITLLCGLTRFPLLTRFPVFYRSLLWGYGSLCIYTRFGAALPYFRYVLTSGATLLALCCAARLASDLAGERIAPSGNQLFGYLRRCLFYWGLILLTIPLQF